MNPGYVHEDQLDAARTASFDPRVLNIIMFATEQCNFRCSYCYETFERGAMSQRVLGSVLKLIETRSAKLAHVSINWFGGEPLLSWKPIVRFCESLSAIEHRNNFSRQDSITTNAFLLTRPVARALIKCKINVFQITMDGPREFHDTTRLAKNGSGTYDEILKNLKNLKTLDEDYQVAIRVHVNAKNYNAIPEFVSYLDNEFGDDPRFGIHIIPVERYDYGASKNYGNYVSPDEYRHALNGAIQSVNHLRLLNVPKGNCYVCYASKANSLVVRSDGKLMKCTVAVDDPRNHVGEINEDGSLSIDQAKFRWWISGFDTSNKKMLACPNSCATTPL